MKNAKIKKYVKTEEAQEELKHSSLFFRQTLSKILEAELNSLEVFDDYDMSNWHIKQAEVNGKRKAYKMVLNLLDLN